MQNRQKKAKKRKTQQVIFKLGSLFKPGNLGYTVACTPESFGIDCPEPCGHKLVNAVIGTSMDLSDCPLAARIREKLSTLNYPILFDQTSDESFAGYKAHNGDIIFNFCDPCEKCLTNEWCREHNYRNPECPKISQFCITRIAEKQN